MNKPRFEDIHTAIMKRKNTCPICGKLKEANHRNACKRSN